MATGYLDPNGQVSNAGWVDQGLVNSTNIYVSIDDGMRQPTAPNGTDYAYTTTDGGTVVFSMPTLSGVLSVSQIKVWLYGEYFDTGGAGEGILISAKIGGAFQINTRVYAAGVGSLTWVSVTYTGSYTQSDIDNLEIRLTHEDAGIWGNESYVHAVYAEVTYTQDTSA